MLSVPLQTSFSTDGGKSFPNEQGGIFSSACRSPGYLGLHEAAACG